MIDGSLLTGSCPLSAREFRLAKMDDVLRLLPTTFSVSEQLERVR